MPRLENKGKMQGLGNKTREMEKKRAAFLAQEYVPVCECYRFPLKMG